ncbi:extracellular solute-binding protein [Vallitalea maricola]|uniref:Extracellular solute-binding protein n=1 Tax=Vallitalea maricola TaxID=3074433 RepID=A0ACB5UI97_9FIRM|nr:extracellular solute-binding protein [Vallitalea sp. AN17-2]
MNKKTLAIIVIVMGLLITTFLARYNDKNMEQNTQVKNDNNNLIGTNFENLDLPENYDIRQFEGITLNFIVENNLYANVILHESEEFQDITGINIKVKAVDFDTLIQKVNLDFIAKDGKYQLIYVDPYQTLNRFYDYLEVLNSYNTNPDYPHIIGYTDDFFEYQTRVISYFEEDTHLYTVPFDSTTMILYYRKDIFDAYRDRFIEEKGYDPTPGTKGFTWEKYIEVSRWIDENVPDEEIKYGSGHMAQKHNSIFCDFSNVLASYGGDYFFDENINTLGLKSFKNINVKDKEFLKALDVYKQILKAAAPESVEWNWTDSANAFRNGEIAMMPNWDENYTYMEDELHSKVAGKVGYSILPNGDERSANIFGGSGIGINKYASDIEKQASWLFITWATSKDMQLKVLEHPEGGSLPTRKSAYDINTETVDIQFEDNFIKHKSAVLDAWKPENLYLRPKISNFYDVEQIIISNLHDMIKYDLDSKEVSDRIYEELRQIRLQE